MEFDQYPSELLSQVVVYKTPDASLVGQGLSGTVDLQTVRPLSYGERTMSVNARYDQNKVRGEKDEGYRFSATWIDQFADDRIGLMLAVAKMDSPQPSLQNESSSYANVPGRTDVQVLGTARLQRVESTQERTGLAATVQFKPNDFYEGTLDLLYSKFLKTEDKSGFEFSTVFAPAGWALVDYSVNGRTATTSSWTGMRPLVMMISNPIDDRLRSLGFNNKFRFGDNWLVNADASVSAIKRDMRMLDSTPGSPPAPAPRSTSRSIPAAGSTTTSSARATTIPPTSC